MQSSRAWMLVLPVGLAGAVGCELVSGLTGDAMLGTGGGTSSAAGTGGKPAATSSASTTGGGSTSSQATGTGGGPVCSTTTCNSASDCPVPSNQCEAAVCTSGCCTTGNQPQGHACNSGSGSFCDGSGDCVGCVKQTDCQTPTSMCTTVACTGGTCVTGNAMAGTGCSDNGGKVCDGAGHCAQCASDTDCTGSASGATCCEGSCVDTSSDGANCGACGHDCLGGGCAGSMCQPVVLASGQNPQDIAADGTNVYWLNLNATDETVKQCAVSNCSGTMITLGHSATPGRIAVSSTTVFWTTGTSGTLVACTIGGCAGTPIQIATGTEPRGIAVLPDGAHIVWTDDVSGTILMCNATGGACSTTRTTLASSIDSPLAVAADSNNAYFLFSSGGVGQVALTGGAVTTLFSSGTSVWNIAASATTVYWTDYSLGGPFAVPIGSGKVSKLATLDTFGLAVDSQYVYWTDSTPEVAKCPLSGCTSGTIRLATVQSMGPLAIDGQRVYWGDTKAGTVSWVAK